MKLSIIANVLSLVLNGATSFTSDYPAISIFFVAANSICLVALVYRDKRTHLKNIFFGSIGVVPLFFLYILAGGLFSSLSSYGVNGSMGDWQINHVWPHYLGLFVWLIAVPGLLFWVYKLTLGKLIKK